MTQPVEVVINGRDNTGGAFASAGGGLAKIGQIAAGILTSQVFTALAKGAVDFTKSVITEGREAALVTAGLEQTLKTMGNASGQTVDSISRMSAAISENSKYTDDAIMSSASLMLTFDKIGKETFPRAQQMAVDMAAKFDMDLGQATTGLSKALQGTSGSLGALSKQGITFTDEQKKVIEKLFETGQAAEAQAMIMDAIGPQVDGFAATQVTAWEKVSKKFDNMKERLAAGLLPTIDKLGETFSAVLDNPAVQSALENLTVWLGDNLPKALDAIIKGFESFAGAGDKAREFISPFLPSIKSVSDTFEKMRPSLEKTAGLLGGKLADAGKALSERIMPFLVQQFDKFASWLAENRPLIEQFAALMGQKFGEMAGKLTLVWSIIEPLLSGLFSIILKIGTLIMQVATGDWAGAWESMKSILFTAWESIKSSIIAAAEYIASYFGGGTFEEMKATWSNNWEQFKQIASKIMDNIKSAISNKLNEIKTAFKNAWSNIVQSARTFGSNLISTLVSVISSAISAVMGALSGFVEVGSSIIQNIITGIQNNISALISYLSETVSGIVDDILSNIVPSESEEPAPPDDVIGPGIRKMGVSNLIGGGAGGGTSNSVRTSSTTNYYNARITIYNGYGTSNDRKAMKALT